MGIFDIPVPINTAGGAPVASEALNTTGHNAGASPFSLDLGGLMNSLLGRGQAASFYDEFYNSFLTTGNSLPLGALWLVYIQDMPNSILLQSIYNEQEGSDLTSKWIEEAAAEGKRKRGILLAQGVKIIGDGANYSREGYSNIGLPKGPMAGGRSDFGVLNISFLENNISFVDYALRPWAVAIAHEGLTNPQLKANNITVWALSKMGARTNLARRKVVKYNNCFPIGIDEQEYNYGGGDVKILRQVKFGFSNYTMEDGDDSVLELVTYGEEENAILSFLKRQGAAAVEEIKRQFGANSLQQYLGNIAERVRGFGASVVSNTVRGAITNSAGPIQRAIDNGISGLEAGGYDAALNVSGGINRAVRDSINGITGRDINSDTPRGRSGSVNLATQRAVEATSEEASSNRLGANGFTAKRIPADDTPIFIRETITDNTVQSVPVVDVNKQVPKLDTPLFTVAPFTENADGGVTFNRPPRGANGDPNADTVTNKTPLTTFKRKATSKDDVPNNLVPNSSIDIQISTNDAITTTSTLAGFKPVETNKDDVPSITGQRENTP